jgi:predicted metalloprotease with PDZ domain
VRGSRSYLGIDTRDVSPERASKLRLPDDRGVEVVMVDQDAPAGKAGLKEHDVITRFNGKEVTDMDQLRNLIRETPPDTTVSVNLYRDGKPLDLKVKLAGRPVYSGEMIKIPRINIPPMPDFDVPTVMMLSRRNGLTVEPITRQLGEAFGCKEGRGVLIRSVEKNSPAEIAGFRAGDIIVRVGNEPIETVNDWNQVMRQQQAGKINVTVVREKREQNVTFALPEKRSEGSAVDFHGLQEDLAKMQVQIADIGPEVEKAMAEAQEQWAKTWNSPEFRKQMEDAQREARKAMQLNRAEIQRQVEQARREAERARKDWEKQQKEWQKDWQNEKE